MPVIGTLGVIERAADQGLIDLPAVIKKLEQASFRVSRRLLDELLQRNLAQTQSLAGHFSPQPVSSRRSPRLHSEPFEIR